MLAKQALLTSSLGRAQKNSRFRVKNSAACICLVYRPCAHSTNQRWEAAEGLRLGRPFHAACPVQVLVCRNLPNLHNM